MISILTLKTFVNERLSAAAEEICMVVERMITDYEDEALRSKHHIDKQPGRVLDKASKSHKLHRAADIPEHQQRIVKMFKEESDGGGGGGGGGDEHSPDGNDDEENSPEETITASEGGYDGDDHDEDEDFPGFPASDSPLPPVCVDSEDSLEEQERSYSLVVQEEPESPQMKAGQEELKAVADWSALSLTSLDGRARGDILSGISEHQQLIVKMLEEESDDNDDFPGFPASEVCSEQQERSPSLSPSLVQEDPESPRVKEEPEELVPIPEMADVSTLTTLEDTKSLLGTLSAVTNLPDTVSTATTSGPHWPTDMTPAEPELQLGVCSDSWMDRLCSLAECLVGMRNETGPTLNTQQANTIIALWENLLPILYDQRQVAQHQCLSVHYRPIKSLIILDLGTGSHAQWPDCCHLVESILVKLCDIHKKSIKGQACYTLRWTPVLREYNKICQILRNRTVAENTNLELFMVSQDVFIDWHGRRMRMQDCSILLQGVTSASILAPPPAAPPQPRRQNPYHSHSTAELPVLLYYDESGMDTSESAAPVEHPHPSQSDSPTLTAERQTSPQRSPPSTSDPCPVFMIPQVPTCKKCSQPCKKETSHRHYLGSVYCPQQAGVPLDEWKEEVRHRSWRRLTLLGLRPILKTSSKS